jgi:integrase/recombinase XerD
MQLLQPPPPSAGLKPLRRSPAVERQKAMPDNVYEKLLDYAKWRPREHALVLFLGDSGCRIGGAAGLRWSDIDFENMRAQVTEKGAKTRYVFFGEECARALEGWRKIHLQPIDGYVFQKHGHRMKNDSLGDFFERVCARAKVGTWGPHSLRHRKGFQFSDQRISVSVAATALGHESKSTTYNHYYPDDLDRAQAAIMELSHKQPAPDEKIITFRRKTEGE